MAKTMQVAWVDLTVDDAEGLRDFYADVVGWTPEGVDCGGYDDYNMNDGDGKAVAGVCHKRDINATMPSQWMVYFTVPDLGKCLEIVKAKGGEVLIDRRQAGGGGFAVIQDPSGAVCALYEVAE